MATKATATNADESAYCAGVTCASEVGQAVAALSGRWAVKVLESLYFAGGSSRFRDLQRRIGTISQKELSRQLGNLAQHLVVRRSVQEDPPSLIVYELTEQGFGLMRRMQALGEWAKESRLKRNLPCEIAQGASEICPQQRKASWIDPLISAPARQSSAR